MRTTLAFLYTYFFLLLLLPIASFAQVKPEVTLAGGLLDTEVIFAQVQSHDPKKTSSTKTIYDIPSEDNFSYLYANGSFEVFDIIKTFPENLSLPTTINVIGLKLSIFIPHAEDETSESATIVPPNFTDLQTNYLGLFKAVSDLSYFSYDPKLVEVIKFYQSQGITFYRLYNQDAIYETSTANATATTIIDSHLTLPNAIFDDITTLTDRRATLKTLTPAEQSQLATIMKTDAGKLIPGLLSSSTYLDAAPAAAAPALVAATTVAGLCDSISADCPSSHLDQKFKCIPPGPLTLIP